MTTLLEVDGGMPDEADTNIASKGPRRPRSHNARILGSRAYAEIPAKTRRARKNRAQRQARKANR